MQRTRSRAGLSFSVAAAAAECSVAALTGRVFHNDIVDADVRSVDVDERAHYRYLPRTIYTISCNVHICMQILYVNIA